MNAYFTSFGYAMLALLSVPLLVLLITIPARLFVRYIEWLIELVQDVPKPWDSIMYYALAFGSIFGIPAGIITFILTLP